MKFSGSFKYLISKHNNVYLAHCDADSNKTLLKQLVLHFKNATQPNYV